MPPRSRNRLAALGWCVFVALMSSAQGCCPSGAARVRSHATAGGESVGDVLRGEASYYANSLSGRRTASGERYNPRKLTAANRWLPFGTRLRVTRRDTGRSVTVTVNDRGPFGQRRRVLDLSRAAAEKLDMIGAGAVQIEAVVVD
jgi:rare lipoprotein A